jgi:hypothetical protein
MEKKTKKLKDNGVRNCVQSGKCKTPKECMPKKECKLKGKVGKYGLYNK